MLVFVIGQRGRGGFLMERNLLPGEDRGPDGEEGVAVGSKLFWYCVWGAMALIAAVNALASYSVFSGRYGLFFSILLAAVAAVQLALRGWALPREEFALAAIVLVLFGAGQAEQRLHTVPPRLDFSAYYVAGRLASEKPPESLYYHSVYPDGRIDPAAYADGWPRVTSQYGVSKAITFVYPPLFAVLMKPFAYFSYDVAYVLWTIVTVVLTFASVLFCLSLGERRVSIELALILIVGLFSYFPFYEELVLGQVGSLILFVCACGVWLLSRNRIWSSAFCLALATMIKITPVIVVPLLVFHRKWKWLAAYGCWMVCMLAFSIWQAGWGAHAQFLHNVMPSVSCGIPSSYNASLVVYVQELFLGYVPTAKLPPALPALACTVSKAVSFVIFGAMIIRFYLYRRAQNLTRHLILMILVSLVISPISWWHHYTIALLPFIYLWCTMREPSRDMLLLASVLVVGTNVAGFGVQLSSNHVLQLILAAIVPLLTLGLAYFKVVQDEPANSVSGPVSRESMRLGAATPS
jgi:hypothetical protein